jgi:hypothetical protein
LSDILKNNTLIFQNKSELKKIMLLIVGIIIIILALFLALGIVGISIKERDNEGYYGLFICLALVIVGVLCIRNAK